MGQNAGYDVLSSPINTGMRGSCKFSALKSTSKIALWVTLQAENLPNPSIYRIFAAFKTPKNAAYEQEKVS